MVCRQGYLSEVAKEKRKIYAANEQLCRGSTGLNVSIRSTLMNRLSRLPMLVMFTLNKTHYLLTFSVAIWIKFYLFYVLSERRNICSYFGKSIDDTLEISHFSPVVARQHTFRRHLDFTADK